jgi:peptide/nickel transport system substrate-binding protein
MVEGAPQITKLELKVMPDGAQRAAQLFAGDLDMALDLPPDQFERARSEPRLRGEKVPGLFYAYVGWNTTRVPLGDPQVRRLLTMAIDRPRMIKELLGGAGRIAGGPVPSSLWIHDPGVKPIAYDPAQARRQLEADAFIDNDGDGVLERAGKPFRFKLDVLQGSALDEKIATIIRSDLRQIGVEVEIQPLAGAAFEERRRSGDFDAFLSSWDPGTRVDLTPLFHSSSIGPSLNYVKLFIPELDGLIERAQQAASPEALVAGWRAVERMVAEVQPYTFLFERDRLVALDRRFQNVALDLRGPLATVDAWQVEPKP